MINCNEYIRPDLEFCFDLDFTAVLPVYRAHPYDELKI